MIPHLRPLLRSWDMSLTNQETPLKVRNKC